MATIRKKKVNECWDKSFYNIVVISLLSGYKIKIFGHLYKYILLASVAPNLEMESIFLGIYRLSWNQGTRLSRWLLCHLEVFKAVLLEQPFMYSFSYLSIKDSYIIVQ